MYSLWENAWSYSPLPPRPSPNPNSLPSSFNFPTVSPGTALKSPPAAPLFVLFECIQDAQLSVKRGYSSFVQIFDLGKVWCEGNIYNNKDVSKCTRVFFAILCLLTLTSARKLTTLQRATGGGGRGREGFWQRNSARSGKEGCLLVECL